jgi:hypothetical protein
MITEGIADLGGDAGPIRSLASRHNNNERPHEALDLGVPVSRYRVSPPSFEERLELVVGNLARWARGLQLLDVDGTFAVYVCHTLACVIDLQEE